MKHRFGIDCAAVGMLALTLSANAATGVVTRGHAERITSGRPTATASSHVTTASPAILYEQMDHASNYNTGSQYFGATDNSSLNDQVVDDFVVPVGSRWVIDGVEAAGVFVNGTGSAYGFNVFIYADDDGLPGAWLASRPVSYTNGANPVIAFTPPIVLSAGTYWISLQADMYLSAGQWGWVGRTVTNNNPALYRNPEGGIGVGCTSWTVMSSCIANTGPDVLFRLRGTSVSPSTWIVITDQDDAVPGNDCYTDHTCATLRDAIHSAVPGDTIIFDLGTLPATIKLANSAPLNLGPGITIHGPGFDKLTISAQTASRVFVLPDRDSSVLAVTIDNLTIANGAVIGVAGFDRAPATTLGEDGAAGLAGDTVYGGCIYVGTHNALHLNFDLVTGCFSLGGRGGAGGAGAQGAAGTDDNNEDEQPGGVGGTGGNGGTGGVGGAAFGGAVAAFGALYLDSTTISSSYAAAGPGGGGGAGGKGGTGGHGGDGLWRCPGSCGYSTPGGTGGAGGRGGNGGTGGAMGKGAGGAIYAPEAGSVSLNNSTLVDNTAITGFFGTTGGDGGPSGPGGVGGVGGLGTTLGASGATGALGIGGIGGDGGSAEGGAIHNAATQTATLLVHTTIAFNDAIAGKGGLGKNGSASGNDGWNGGGGFMNIAGSLVAVENSIIAQNDRTDAAGGTYRSNCHFVQGAITMFGDNLADDTGNTHCYFDTIGDPKFAPAQGGHDAYSWGGNGLPVLMPLPGSPAIRGAKPHVVGGFIVDGCADPVDERGMARPIGTAVTCDLGAVEAGNDIIFIDGFDSSP